MDKYQKVSHLFEIVSIGIAAAASQAITSWIVSFQNSLIPSWVPVLVTIIGVVLLNEIVAYALQAFYQQFKFIRMWLIGSQFVEGTWIEYISANDQIISIGISTIESCGIELQVHGYNYDLQGNLRYDFSSKPDMVKMEWPVFRYAYEDRPFQGTENIVAGVAHIKFGPTGHRPTMYTGAFTHIGTGNLTGIEARLIIDGKDLKALRDATQVRSILKKYLQQRTMEIEGAVKQN